MMKTKNCAPAAVAAALMSAALAGSASATPPTRNDLGSTFKLISTGQTSTIEIRLKPKTSFDSVSVEAASGVGSLTPPCSFAAVVVGGSYVCRVHVTHQPGTPSLTVNVVGERTVDPAKPRVLEVRHFTLASPGFVAPAARKAEQVTPGLKLTPRQEGSK